LTLSSFALLALAATQGSPDEMRLMRFPDVYGDTIVFTYASDLWTVDANGGRATRLTSHAGTEAYAKFSPDGKWIAFTASYDGNPDVYLVSSEGGEPTRLTYNPEPDVVTGWTPDGKVAFRSESGSWGGFMERLWTIDPKGGVPRETPVYEFSQGTFSPDGTKVAYNRSASHQFNWRRYRGGTQGKISFLDLKTLAYSELPAGRENSWFPMWVKNEVFFVSDKNLGTVNLYKHDLGSKRTEQLTQYSDADMRWPSTDGKRIVFERDGYLWLYDLGTRTARKVNARIVGDKISARPQMRQLGNQIAYISLSPSGNRVAVEARGEIFSVPARNGDTRNLHETAGSRDRWPTWSPDGNTIAYLSDETGEMELYTIPQKGGPTTQITRNSGINWAEMRYSPDGKTMSVATRDNKLLLIDMASKKVTKALENRYQSLSNYDWSPDSKWIVFIDTQPSLMGAVSFYDVATGKVTKGTEGFYRDDAVTFDLDGKYVYIVSARTYAPEGGAFEFNGNMSGDAQRIYFIPLTKEMTNPLTPGGDEEPGTAEKPKPPAGGPPAGGPPQGPPAGGGGDAGEAPKGPSVKIDFEGLNDRVYPLPLPPGNYPFIIGLRNSVMYFTNGNLFQFDLGQRQPVPLSPEPIAVPGLQLSFNATRTKVAYYGGGTLGIVNVAPGAMRFGAGRVNTNDVAAVVDPRKEWNQIFHEAWRWYRDEFYDPKMVGIDWNTVRKQYEAYLPYVAHRADLNYVLGLMIGELGTGHSYVGGGDVGAPGTPVPIGALGCDFGTVGDYVTFKKIYRGDTFTEERGPLAEPGMNLKDGDYLLAIDGKPVRSTMNPSSLLVNKAGKTVVLTVNSSPSDTGARKISVRPIGTDQGLRYMDWVETNRRKVLELSGGKIGYMHVPNTGAEGFIGFARGYWANADKDALLIDERFNGGGDIAWYLVERLTRRTLGGLRSRHGDDIFYPWQSPMGPKAMLINGYAGSGGDLFPYMFKQEKLGPLIGTRTWGGLVGIQGSAPLVDGGFLTAPAFGLYDQEKGEWIAENTGVDPDIEVDLRPDLLAKGEDPQLAAAVKYLLDELKKGKAAPKRPNFPVMKPGK